MPYYAITGETGLQWTGYAGNATEAVRLHMADIGVNSYRDPIVLELPVPPEGWEGAGVAEIIRKVGDYKVRVFPQPDCRDHWISMQFHAEEAAIAGIVGALDVLGDWVDEHGKIVRVASQVRVNGHTFDWDAVVNSMDRGILEDMDNAGIRAEPLTAGDIKALSLDEFVDIYRERHAERFGEQFFVN